MKTELAKDVKQETTEAIEATETFVLKARDIAAKGARAYVGLFGFAYERAAKRFAKMTEGSDDLFADLVKRGEVIEKQALVAANDAKSRVVKLYAEGSEKVRDAIPTRGERVEELEAEGMSAGGMVTVTLTGKGLMKGLTIDPSLLKEGEEEILEDLIIAAHNAAKARAEDLAREKTAELTAGLPIPPGMKLPF